MKKLLYLLLLLPLGLLASCSDDNDLPDVDVNVSFDNVVAADNQLYVVKGDSLKVTGVYIKGNNNQTAVINSINYMWNNTLVLWNPISPYNADFVTDHTKPGTYLLTLNMDIAQVDKTLAYCILDFKVTVVSDASQLPGGASPGTYNADFHIAAHEKD